MEFRKKILITVLAASCQLAFANPQTVNSYTDLETILAQGGNVKAVIDFSKCAPAAETMGSLNFSTFNKYLLNTGAQYKETIATATTVISHTNRLGYILNYVRLRVFKDNSTEILSEFIDPKNYVQLTSSAHSCKLNSGVSLYLMKDA